MKSYKNIPEELRESLEKIIQSNILSETEPGKNLIQTGSPSLNSDDLLGGIDTLLGGWLTEGENCRQFEKELANYINSKYAVLVNSGSSANLLAFSSLTSPKLGDRAIKNGDEVIAVAAAFPTTVNPIIQNGCIPVFIDIEIPSYNIDVKQIENAITEKTKAIFIAHSLGNPFDLDAIVNLCKKHNIWLIEDNCDALGSTYNGKKTGSFGDLSTLSFFPAHQITTGEGGAVLINNPKLKKIVESMRNWGRDCWCIPGDDDTCGIRFNQNHGELPKGYDHKYVFSHIGYNFKMTDSQAAIGLNQLSRIDEFVKARRENHNKLNELLSEFKDFMVLPETNKKSNPSWFGFIITCKPNKLSRDKITSFLNSKNIGTRLFFAGNILKHPAYLNIDCKVIGNLKNTNTVMDNSFWIGVWPGISESHINYIHSVFKEYFENNI